MSVTTNYLVTGTVDSTVQSLVSGGGNVARALVAAYEAQQREDAVLGYYLEPRVGLTADDTPVITNQGTTPVTDGTDPATQEIQLFGSNLMGVGTLTLAQNLLGKRWIRGFSPGAYTYGYANTYRMSNSMQTYGTGGAQGLNPNDNYGYTANPIYCDFVLDGDVVYFRMVSGNKFNIWVNGNLLNVAAAASTNVTYAAADYSYSPGVGGHGWVKVKFTTSARRTIRIAIIASCSLGNLFTRATSTIVPACSTPIEWVHFSDSFGQQGMWGIPEWLSSRYGRSLNFINVSCGGTSFSQGNDVGDTNPTSARFRQQMQGHWKYCSPQIVTGLVGKNDDAVVDQSAVRAAAVLMLTELRALFPNAIVVIFTANTGPYAIAYGNDLIVESTLLAACSAVPGVNAVPMQSAAIGPFLRGQGVAWAPAAGPLTLASNINGATTGQLSTAWTGVTGLYSITFTIAGGKDIRRGTLTNGSTAITGLSSAITTASTTCPDGRGNTDVYSGVAASGSSDTLHPTPAGNKATGLWIAARLYELLRTLA